MSEPIDPTAIPPTPPAARSWSESLIFMALGNALRRRMLEAIIRRREGFSIQQMAAEVGEKRSITGKHLALLRQTEIVVLDTAHADGREQFHILNPVLRPPDGAPLVFDFGFLVLRFAGTMTPAVA